MVKNLLRLFSVLLLLLFFAGKIQAQSWLPLGPDDNNQLSDGAVTYTNIVTDPDGVPYVAYSDGSNSGKATVKKFDGNNWTTVGSIGFSAGQAMEISLAFNGTTPYITYSDVPKNGKATVMKFDGSNWVNVGSSGFSAGLTKSISLAFIGTTPYIAYFDYENSKAVVMRFNNGSWATVGNSPGSLSRSVPYISFAVNGNIPYVAYTDPGNSNRATVKQFNGTDWLTVGAVGFSAGQALIPKLTFNNSTPYIVYGDGASSGKATVKQFNGTDWITVGTAGFTTSITYDYSLAFSGSTPYVAYVIGNVGKAAVMMFNGSNWVTIGGPSISAGAASYISLAITGNTPYVVYADAGNSGKATVQKLNGNSWTAVGVGGLSDGPAYPSLAVNGDTPYVSYSDSNNGGKATVKKFNGSNWITVGTAGFSAGVATPLIAFSSNTPYIAYVDPVSSKPTVMMFDGSSWITLGVLNVTVGNGYYISLVCDKSVPYLAYVDGQNNNKATVLKYDGNNWVTVGSASFSTGSATYLSLAFNGNSLYLAYQDTPIPYTPNTFGKATVKKFDGRDWVTIGPERFSAFTAYFNSLAFNSNTPYLAFQDGNSSSKATVMKFNGSNWVTVGAAGFSTSNAYSTSLAFNSNTPYVSYVDGSLTSKTTVKKFDGSSWITLGTAGFSAGSAISTQIIANNNNIYVAYNTASGTYVKYYVEPPILSTNTKLANLTLSAGALNPAFSADTISYRANVSSADSIIKVTPTINDANAKVTVNGTAVSSEIASGSISLKVGSNTITTIVTAQDGITTQTYTVTVNRAKTPQTISFATIPAKIFGDADFPLIATSSSGLPITYTNSNPAVATVSAAGTIHILATGTTNITAFQAGNASYLAVADVVQILTVNPVLQPPVQAQSWLPLGPDDNNQPSTNLINNLHIVTDANGTPYVAYADYGHQNSKITIKKFNGNSWVPVGKPGFSAGVANSISLAFNGTTPYVAYYDAGNNNEPTVMKFNGSNWEPVGPLGFSGDLSAGTGGFISLAFNSGIPYVAFADYNWGYSSGKATVMKFDGSNWIRVGTPGFSTGGSYSLALAFNGNTPYVSYYDVANGNKANVMKFDGSNWINVGAPGFSVGEVASTSLAFNGNTPFIAYADGSNGNKATVMKFDGTNWVAVGNTGFSKGDAGYLSLVFNGDKPVVIYTDGGNNVKATVMMLNGDSWQQLGEDFSADQASFTSISFSGSIPYIAYNDSGNAGKATVKKYTGSSWQTVGTPSFTKGYSISTSLAFNGSTPYVAYQDFGNNYKTSVAKFTAGKWTVVGKLGFTAGETYYTSLAFNNTTPYVAYRDISNSNKVTVMRFDGSNWVTVGSPGFSVGSVDYVSIVIKNGIPYVAYRDGAFGNKVTVMKFVNNGWEVVGWPGFSGNSSTLEADYISLAFNGDVPYVAYMDYRYGYTGGKATVMKFEGGSWLTVGTAGFTTGAASYTSIAFNNGTPYLAYADGSNSGKATVKKFDGKDWLPVGGGFSAGSATYTSLIFNGDVPYVSYQDNANDDKATVMKFDGSSWTAVGGVAGFSADEANHPSVAINNNNVYVAYDSRGVFVKYYGSSSPVSTNPRLANLALSAGTLSPTFTPDSTAYTVNVDNLTSNLQVTPTLADATASVTVNGAAVSSGTASAAIPLTIGSNEIKAVVTAQNGTTQKTYTLTVNRTKAVQTITFATLPAKAYGDADFTIVATSDNSTIPIIYSSSNTAVASVVNGKVHIVSAGTATITASQVVNNSFLAATDVTQTLMVNKASLIITADNQTKTYSAVNPALTVSYNGFVNGDIQDSLTTKPTVSTTATATSAAGTYPILVEGAASSNYNITYVNGTLTIGQSNQNITFDALPSKTYGDADFTLIAKSSSGLSVTYTSSNPAVATVSAAGMVHILSAGTADITASQAGDGNYSTATSVTQILTVNKASLTITANNQTKTYSSANPALTVAYAGFLNGETSTVLTAQVAISTTATTTSDAGTYPITPSGADAANYSFIYVPGTLTVTQASQAITFATVPAKAYGDADFNPGAVSSSGLPVNYTSSNPNVLAVVNGKLHVVGAGSSTITASQAGNVNYLPAASVSQDIQVIFTLPSNNFTISATGESCKNSSNGEINITALSNLNYTAAIVSAGTSMTYPFTGKLSVKNLPAGTYSVCITIAAYPAFKQCFDVTVTAPKDLSVYPVVNPTSATLSLNLSGSSLYNINLNGTSYTTTKSSISLPLAAGKNTLSVTTANVCQGVYEKTIELPVKITAYPNPFENRLSLSLVNDHSSSATGEVYNMQGRLVYSGKTSVSQGICSFDLSTLSPGSYVLKLVLDQSETNIKIIKK
ncbi:MAG: MBG domain-containing protein [Janthinobacterium lividum]